MKFSCDNLCYAGFVWWITAFIWVSQPVVGAQEAVPPPAEGPTAASGAEPVEAAADEGSDGGDSDAPVPAERKVRRVREKEADGSQAPNRFSGDPVIRSRYKVNSQALEVDPD